MGRAWIAVAVGATLLGCGSPDGAANPDAPDGGPTVDLDAALHRPLTVSTVEVARRLSTTLWQEPPDEALLARASSLATAGDVGALAREMFADSRVHLGLAAFARKWLGLEGLEGTDIDHDAYPEWGADLAHDMVAQAEEFVTSVFVADRADLSMLYEAPYTFANERLATIYGIQGIVGPELRRVSLEPTQRLGVLALLGWLPKISGRAPVWPSRRGGYVDAHVACLHLSEPTERFRVDFPADGRTAREVQDEATSSGTCQSCHRVLGTMGYAFEHFDAIGRYRESDGSGRVNAAGMLPGEFAGSEQTTAYDGAPSFVHLLLRSGRVPDCLVRHWFSFAVAGFVAMDESDDRTVPAQALAVTEADLIFEASAFQLRELVVAVAQSEVFLSP